MLEELDITELNWLGLLSGMVEKTGLGEIVEKLMPKKRADTIVSNGNCAKALMLNMLSTKRAPLSMVSSNFQTMPTEHLIGSGVLPKHLNDDCLGRFLDNFHDAGVEGQVKGDIGEEGSLVSWHASFEKTRNKELAERYPDQADFLKRLNERMVDLEDVFKRDYVDIRFGGSTSIKKVLPVVCPHLSYEEEDVQDGASAMEAWQRMIAADNAEADQIADQLFSYCKLDTFAMVEIYRFLRQLVDGAE